MRTWSVLGSVPLMGSGVFGLSHGLLDRLKSLCIISSVLNAKRQTKQYKTE